jgi:hypothetical protein
MNKKEHLEFLKIADWCDITEMLLELEQQRYNLKDLMSKKQLKELDELIEIYDAHRAETLNKISKEGGFSRSVGLEIQDYMDMQPDIGDLEDDY